MSLDKLDHATTARWVIRADDSDIILAALRNTFEEVNGCRAGNLTKQTLNLSLDLEIADRDKIKYIDNLIKDSSEIIKAEVIYRSVPEV